MKKIFKVAAATMLTGLIFTACQNEQVETDIIDSIVTPVDLEGEIIEGSYIVVLDSEEIEPVSSRLSGLRYSGREAKSKLSKGLEKEAIKEINAKLTSDDFNKEKITGYYSTQFAGFSIKNVSKQELVAISKISGVKEIYNDMMVANPMESSFAEDVESAADSRLAQNTPCGIQRAGGFVNSANAQSWIWVIDTGIDLDHPDLNVVTNTRYARSFVGGSANDCNGHGTHVAGTAAAKNNNIGVVGISAGAPVVPVRVFGCSGGASTSAILSAINHVGQNDLPGDVVNMSLGGFSGNGCSTRSPYASALRALGNAGTHIALAAGNSSANSTTYSPACINGNRIYTVASMTCNFGWSSFSNYNRSAVDVIATGSDVRSTWLNGGYRTISGTSMASPHVAGILHARNGAPRSSRTVTFRGQRYPVARLR